MKVLLTGATGLLGGALLGLLFAAGHEVRCLVREGSAGARSLEVWRAEVVRGDARSVEDLHRALAGADALLHLAGIEYAPQVVEAARRAGVDRLVVVGSTSAHSAYPSRSGPKLRMERVVRESELGWTIVRPTMIYGSERDKNVHRLLRFLGPFARLPDVRPRHEPLAAGLPRGLRQGRLRGPRAPAAVGRSYDLPGAEPLTYLDLVETAAGALGREPRVVGLPLEPVRRALAAAERLRLPLPISSEQVMRLREDKAYPYEEAGRDLDYAPRPFHEGVALEVARLRELGLVRQ